MLIFLKSNVALVELKYPHIFSMYKKIHYEYLAHNHRMIWTNPRNIKPNPRIYFTQMSGSNSSL